MKQCIAERRLLYSLKDSAVRKELIIRIGVPYTDETGIVKCPVEWDGLFENFADIGGMDSLHALHLATDVDSLLKKLQNKYDFFWEDGEPYFEE